MIEELYDQLIATRYVTNRSLETLVQETVKTISHSNWTPKWLVYIYVIDSLAKSSQTDQSYELYERRFHFIFEALFQSLLNHEELNDDCLTTLTELLIEQARQTLSPWPRLIQAHTDKFDQKQLEAIYERLSDIDTTISYSFALLFAYLALINGHDEQSLNLLSRHKHELIERDIFPHFSLLKEREQWLTVEQWFKTLFIKHRPSYGSLQPIWEESQAYHAKTPKDQEAIWNRWLMTPNYQRFLHLSQHLTTEEKKARAQTLLTDLENQLYQLESAKVYEQLLLYVKQYERAQEYLLLHELDPIKMRPEKKDLLEMMKREKPKLAIPIYHQLTIRLIERKSRVHYQHAAITVAELKKLYEKVDKIEHFMSYIARLKKQYRTYKAFIEELKSFEL